MHVHVHLCVRRREGGGCIVRHITAPDVQFALQPRLNGGTDRKRENEDVGVMASKQKKEMGTKFWLSTRAGNYFPCIKKKKNHSEFLPYNHSIMERDLQMVCERSSTSPLCLETIGHISLHISEGQCSSSPREVLHKVR